MQMLWNGYVGYSGSVGGNAGLLGAYLVHVVQAALKLMMSARKPGQKREEDARSNMEEALACPAWRC